jgi:hypothetical protein
MRRTSSEAQSTLSCYLRNCVYRPGLKAGELSPAASLREQRPDLFLLKETLYIAALSCSHDRYRNTLQVVSH